MSTWYIIIAIILSVIVSATDINLANNTVIKPSNKTLFLSTIIGFCKYPYCS